MGLVLACHHPYLLKLASTLPTSRDVTLRFHWLAETTGPYSQGYESVMLRWQRISHINLNGALSPQSWWWVFRIHFSGPKGFLLDPCGAIPAELTVEPVVLSGFEHQGQKLLMWLFPPDKQNLKKLVLAAVQQPTLLYILGQSNVHAYKADWFWKLLVPTSRINPSDWPKVVNWCFSSSQLSFDNQHMDPRVLLWRFP